MIIRILSDPSLIGMLMLGIALPTIGIGWYSQTFYKGVIMYRIKSGNFVVRKISDYKAAFDIDYFLAFTFSLLFSLGNIILGLIALITLFNSL